MPATSRNCLFRRKSDLESSFACVFVELIYWFCFKLTVKLLDSRNRRFMISFYDYWKDCFSERLLKIDLAIGGLNCKSMEVSVDALLEFL